MNANAPDEMIDGITDGSPADDRSLVDAWLRSRSGESFRFLYRRHTPHMYRLATGLLRGDQFAAEDAVQESWIRASRQMDRFAWRSSLRTWLCGIVVNCCRELRRLSRWDDLLVQVDPVEAGTRTSPVVGLAVDTIDLLRALESLPDGAREVLVLYGFFGHTHDEIAAILGIAPGTSKSQLSYARERLRERMDIAKGGRE